MDIFAHFVLDTDIDISQAQRCRFQISDFESCKRASTFQMLSNLAKDHAEHASKTSQEPTTCSKISPS
jgi:hypothetical protein